jgi:hypothetical protein
LFSKKSLFVLAQTFNSPSSAATASIAAPSAEAVRSRKGSRSRLPLGLAGAFLLLSAWLLGRTSGLSAHSNVAYWVGVAGGVAMLLLFGYPLRKRVSWLRDAGSTRTWFIVHMLLGIGGPWLILVHSTFRIGSLNAGVALGSMLIVAGSGVVGRYLYVRVHQGLTGERAELKGLQATLAHEHEDMASQLGAMPEVRQRLFDFEEAAKGAASRGALLPLLALGWQARRVKRGVREDLEAARPVSGRVEAALAEDRTQGQAILAHADAYIAQVLRVSQFTAWVRLFALWHVLHVPFVYVMVACAVAHVVAVHAY